jgi:uncharacterized protein YkwD
MLKAVITATLLVSLSACGASVSTGGSSGTPGDGTKVIRMNRIGAAKVQTRHLDAINAIRQARGLTTVSLDESLIKAAQAHAADMAKQNRPWHFGSDGSSPLDRAARVGYAGPLLGENVSETFEDDLNTLDAWVSDPLAASSILDAQARNVGISWHQGGDGKIWWVQMIGG